MKNEIRLSPEEFAEEYLRYTLNGAGKVRGRGFLSPRDFPPLHRIFGSGHSVISWLRGKASELGAACFEIEDRGKRFPYFISGDLLESFRQEPPQTKEDFELRLRKLGYEDWLRPEEARSLLEISRSGCGGLAKLFDSGEAGCKEDLQQMFTGAELKSKSKSFPIEIVPPEMRTLLGEKNG